MSSRPVIALLTDFGLIDHYVGSMKGVVAGICPSAQLIDITHDIPAQDVRAAAFELGACWRYFPAGTVFLTVVDPGVGTARRGVAARIGEMSFVGPDNGLFDLVLADHPVAQAVDLSERTLARPFISPTFHGRDIFAPAAAWLAQRTPLEAFGPSVDVRVRLDWPEPGVTADWITGEVLHVDRFGNLITNIHQRLWPAVVDIDTVTVGEGHAARFVRTYGEANAGDLIALFGSTARLEVAVAQGSAQRRLDAGRGTPVRVRRRA